MKSVKIVLFLYLIFQIVPVSAAPERKGNKNLIIEAIVCEGNKYTSSDYIKKELYLNVGDILDSEKVFDAKLRLGAMQQFKDVHIYLRKGEQKGYVVIVISIKEGAKIQTEINTVVVNHWYLETKGKVTDYNFLGMSKILEGSMSVTDRLNDNGDYYNFRLEYKDPQFLGYNEYFFSSSINTNVFRQEYGESGADWVGNDNPFKIETGNISLDFEVGRRIARYSHIWG